MTNLNIIKNSEKMNTIDTEILKALLAEPSRSIYSLEKKLKENNENVNYPTLLRHIRKLVNDGFLVEEKGVRKNGKPDKRETKKVGLTLKGLVSLILNADLSESESRTIVQRILSKPEFQKFTSLATNKIMQISIASIEKSFKQIRPRINLEHFDEEYVETLIFEIFIVENLLDEIIIAYEEIKSKVRNLPQRKLSQIIQLAKREVKNTPKESVQLLSQIYEYLKDKRERWNQKIELLKFILKVYKKKEGVEP